MNDYTIVDFLEDNDKQRIAIDIPKEMVKILDDYVMLKSKGSRKRLIELIIIKYIMAIKKELY